MNNYIHLFKTGAVVFIISFFALSCKETPIPKPKGYFRIALPEKKYVLFDTIFPYSFEYPVYSKISINNNPNSELYWINLDFPRFNGSLQITYKNLNHNLNKYIEDSHEYVNKHIPKATSIDTKVWSNGAYKVYGLTFDIEGIGVASPYQFYLTDSTTHFLRAALYFNTIPNNDSLAPVIQFIKKDLNHLIETFKWKFLK
ncbi:MAG: gliding motility lipoprotein GldD [Bacteroidetes bacterium CG2_30_32_10]|nr:MAG: gliding motility lipoprotein GldD [Bacteroidetes bacterium CG2_30_32_10]